MPGALVASLLLVVRPGAPSSFLFPVLRKMPSAEMQKVQSTTSPTTRWLGPSCFEWDEWPGVQWSRDDRALGQQ